jgi:hypothetical protein
MTQSYATQRNATRRTRADFAVRGVGLLPLRVADGGAHDAARALEGELEPPEAAGCQVH